MNSDEIMRRLKVLVGMEVDKRPISIYRLEKVAKLDHGYIYKIVNHHERINAGLCKRLGRALELAENGQIVADPQPKDGKKRFSEQTVRVVEKKNPPQAMARRITFGDDGKPTVKTFVYNPAALQK